MAWYWWVLIGWGVMLALFLWFNKRFWDMIHAKEAGLLEGEHAKRG